MIADPADEGQHAPEDAAHWSESWYFDAISDDRTLGVYTRIGRVPSRGKALYTAAIVIPGGQTILLVEPNAPLPDDAHQTVDTTEFFASQQCVAPLQEFRVRLKGNATAWDDHAAPLVPEPGTSVSIELDLTFHTDGLPYRWELTPRYEVPCRVTGTVRIGNTIHEFAGPGQRDHSWGPRDWWSHEWMWSALHFDDGTRTHAVALSDFPGLMIGYDQKDGQLVDLTAGRTEGEQDRDGLVRSERLILDDVGTTIDVRPIGFGPLRLVSDQGQVAWFTRAMVEVENDRGIRGVGWVEWNRVQPAEDSE